MCKIDWELFAAMLTALGTVGIACGTILAAIVAGVRVPKALSDNTRTIDETRERYRNMLLRMIARTEAEHMELHGRSMFPSNFDQWLPLLLKEHPAIGTIEDAKVGITDLMEAGRLTRVHKDQDGPAFLITIRWDANGKRKDTRQQLNDKGEIVGPKTT